MHLICYRNDLRTFDHAGLSAALASGEPVLAIFQACVGQWRAHHLGDNKVACYYQRVKELSKELALLKVPLIISKEDDFTQANQKLVTFCQAASISHLHACAEYEVNESMRDSALADTLHGHGIKTHFWHDSVLFKPGQVVKNDNQMYQVYTPYKKQCLKLLSEHIPACYPRPTQQDSALYQVASAAAAVYPAVTFAAPDAQSLSRASHFPCQQTEVLEQLAKFCQEAVHGYEDGRDYPALSATSRLSVALSLGVISPRQVVNRLVMEQAAPTGHLSNGSATWLNEIIWREFYKHWVALDPAISMGLSVKRQYDLIQWRNEPLEFQAWCAGQTGYPIVDAGMRQLNQTGWMHNRLRMITASFLVKDLQIDWRWGERYFLQHLLDADFAANNGGWQWSASCGYDAAPYFRVFNPTTQSQRFDQDGEFIRQFCPELAELDAKSIHQPSLAGKKYSGELYPSAIVDHRVARQKTLMMYQHALQFGREKFA